MAEAQPQTRQAPLVSPNPATPPVFDTRTRLTNREQKKLQQFTQKLQQKQEKQATMKLGSKELKKADDDTARKRILEEAFYESGKHHERKQSTRNAVSKVAHNMVEGQVNEFRSHHLAEAMEAYRAKFGYDPVLTQEFVNEAIHGKLYRKLHRKKAVIEQGEIIEGVKKATEAREVMRKLAERENTSGDIVDRIVKNSSDDQTAAVVSGRVLSKIISENKTMPRSEIERQLKEAGLEQQERDILTEGLVILGETMKRSGVRMEGESAKAALDHLLFADLSPEQQWRLDRLVKSSNWRGGMGVALYGKNVGLMGLGYGGVVVASNPIGAGVVLATGIGLSVVSRYHQLRYQEGMRAIDRARGVVHEQTPQAKGVVRRGLQEVGKVFNVDWDADPGTRQAQMVRAVVAGGVSSLAFSQFGNLLHHIAEGVGHITNAHEQLTSVATKTCFIAGTMILMADGSQKPIEEIAVGEKVLTYDEKTEHIIVKEVLQVISPIHEDLITITFSDGTKNTNTQDHPYYVIGKGWVSHKPEETRVKYGLFVEQMEIGDRVQKYLGGKLEAIEITDVTITYGRLTTYNLSRVADTHTFFANGVLVHNKTGLAEATPTPSTPTPTNAGDVQSLMNADYFWKRIQGDWNSQQDVSPQRVATLVGDIAGYSGNRIGDAMAHAGQLGEVMPQQEHIPHPNFSDHVTDPKLLSEIHTPPNTHLVYDHDGKIDIVSNNSNTVLASDVAIINDGKLLTGVNASGHEFKIPLQEQSVTSLPSHTPEIMTNDIKGLPENGTQAYGMNDQIVKVEGGGYGLKLNPYEVNGHTANFIIKNVDGHSVRMSIQPGTVITNVPPAASAPVTLYIDGILVPKATMGEAATALGIDSGHLGHAFNLGVTESTDFSQTGQSAISGFGFGVQNSTGLHQLGQVRGLYNPSYDSTKLEQLLNGQQTTVNESYFDLSHIPTGTEPAAVLNGGWQEFLLNHHAVAIGFALGGAYMNGKLNHSLNKNFGRLIPEPGSAKREAIAQIGVVTAIEAVLFTLNPGVATALAIGYLSPFAARMLFTGVSEAGKTLAFVATRGRVGGATPTAHPAPPPPPAGTPPTRGNSLGRILGRNKRTAVGTTPTPVVRPFGTPTPTAATFAPPPAVLTALNGRNRNAQAQQVAAALGGGVIKPENVAATMDAVDRVANRNTGPYNYHQVAQDIVTSNGSTGIDLAIDQNATLAAQVFRQGGTPEELALLRDAIRRAAIADAVNKDPRISPANKIKQAQIRMRQEVDGGSNPQSPQSVVEEVEVLKNVFAQSGSPAAVNRIRAQFSPSQEANKAKRVVAYTAIDNSADPRAKVQEAIQRVQTEIQNAGEVFTSADAAEIAEALRIGFWATDQYIGRTPAEQANNILVGVRGVRYASTDIAIQAVAAVAATLEQGPENGTQEERLQAKANAAMGLINMRRVALNQFEVEPTGAYNIAIALRSLDIDKQLFDAAILTEARRRVGVGVNPVPSRLIIPEQEAVLEAILDTSAGVEDRIKVGIDSLGITQHSTVAEIGELARALAQMQHVFLATPDQLLQASSTYGSLTAVQKSGLVQDFLPFNVGTNTEEKLSYAFAVAGVRKDQAGSLWSSDELDVIDSAAIEILRAPTFAGVNIANVLRGKLTMTEESQEKLAQLLVIDLGDEHQYWIPGVAGAPATPSLENIGEFVIRNTLTCLVSDDMSAEASVKIASKMVAVPPPLSKIATDRDPQDVLHAVMSVIPTDKVKQVATFAALEPINAAGNSSPSLEAANAFMWNTVPEYVTGIKGLVIANRAETEIKEAVGHGGRPISILAPVTTVEGVAKEAYLSAQAQGLSDPAAIAIYITDPMSTDEVVSVAYALDDAHASLDTIRTVMRDKIDHNVMSSEVITYDFLNDYLNTRNGPFTLATAADIVKFAIASGGYDSPISRNQSNLLKGDINTLLAAKAITDRRVIDAAMAAVV